MSAPGKVPVVDDNEETVEVAAFCIEKGVKDVEVIRAVGGAEGLHRVLSQHPGPHQRRSDEYAEIVRVQTPGAKPPVLHTIRRTKMKWC
jgi:hypothetical protein